MDIKNQKTYRLNSAKHDLEVAESLFDSEKYDWCLFVGHLVLEKTLKAYYVGIHHEFPPKIHDLVRLSDLSKIELDEDTLDFLDMVNTFNIATRYPDEKFRFYKICTREFANSNFERIKDVYQWICRQIDTLKR
jgi:HEPN domain-containing protein